jgi:uncharacterized protein YcbX
MKRKRKTLGERLAHVQASREAVESQAAQRIPMNRFRGNIVVTGCEAFAEDEWLAVRVGGSDADESAAAVLRSVKPCSRCKVCNSAVVYSYSSSSII